MQNRLHAAAAALRRYLNPATSPLLFPLRAAAWAAWPYLYACGRRAGYLLAAYGILVTAAIVALIGGMFVDPDAAWACYLAYLAAIDHPGTPREHLYPNVLRSPHMGECLYFLMCPELAAHWEFMVYTPTRDPRSWDMP